MLNVIEIRERAPRSDGSRLRCEPTSAGADIAELARRITSLHSRARGEIDDAVLMLDLAAQHARLIAKQVGEFSARNDFDDHIATIDRLLRIARQMALKL
jgi:hypothetical protein